MLSHSDDGQAFAKVYRKKPLAVRLASDRRGRYAPKRRLRQRLHLIGVHRAVAVRLAGVDDFEIVHAGW
jgi:hypothetical protein